MKKVITLPVLDMVWSWELGGYHVYYETTDGPTLVAEIEANKDGECWEVKIIRHPNQGVDAILPPRAFGEQDAALLYVHTHVAEVYG